MTTTLRITVTDEQGTLLDIATLTAEELAEAQRNPVAAMAFLDSLQVGR
jgi:hypothetical protein